MQSEDQNQRFVEIYNTYSALMFRIACGVLHDEGFAEDAVQQAFLKIYYDMERIDQIQSAQTRAYIIVLVRNTAIDLYRKRKREQVVYFEDMERNLPCNGLLPEETAINSQSEEDVVRAFSELGDKYAEILLMKYCHGYRNKEIAQRLEMTEAAVASRIFQAKRLLLKSLWAKNLQSA